MNSKTIASSRLAKTSKLLYDLTPKTKRSNIIASEPVIPDLANEDSGSTSTAVENQNEYLEESDTERGLYSEVSLMVGESDSRSFSLRLPDRVMSFLEWDCYMVTVQNKSYKLPQKLTVARILQDYLVWFVKNVAFKKKCDNTYTLHTGEVVEVFDPLTSVRYF